MKSTIPRRMPAGVQAARAQEIVNATQATRAELVADVVRLQREVDDLRERFVFLCVDAAPARGTYTWLEELTGIKAAKWKNVFLRRQMPTVEMLLAICNFRRNEALWLMTGEEKPNEVTRLIPSSVPTKKEWELFQAHRNWLKDKKADATAVTNDLGTLARGMPGLKAGRRDR